LKPNALRARLSDLSKDRFIVSTENGETITAHGLFFVRDLLRFMKKDLDYEFEDELEQAKGR
jgi:hypothetical protein